jgi:hypothetical protein
MNTWTFMHLFLLEAFVVTMVFGVWLLTLLHAVRHLNNEKRRMQWVFALVAFNLFAVPFYFVRIYLPLRRTGRSGFNLRDGEYNDTWVL